MPQFDFGRPKSITVNSTAAVISPGTVVDTDNLATGEESTFLPMNHSSFTPAIFVVGGCNLTAAGSVIVTNLTFGFANVRVGDGISLTVAGTGAPTMADTTVASVVSLTQITVAGTITGASTGNSSTVTITPRVAGCTLINGNTTITTSVINGFDRVQPGDSVSILSGSAGGASMTATTVTAVLNPTTITVATAPTVSGSANGTTLTFSAAIGGCTVTATNPVVTTTVPFGFTRVRPGDVVSLSVANGAVLGTATVVTAVNSPTSITLGSALAANGTATAASPTGSTTGGQTSTLVFTPPAISPTAWGIRLLYQRAGSSVTIRPTLYFYDGSLGVVTGTATNATTAINLADSQGNLPTIDLDSFYNSVRVARAV